MRIYKELPQKIAEFRKAEEEDLPYPQLLSLACNLIDMMETELAVEGLLDD